MSCPHKDCFNETVHRARLPCPGLLSELAEDWQRRCALVRHAPGQRLPPKKDATQCCMLGRCVCKGVGLQSLRMHENLVQLMRPYLAQPNSRKRKADAERKPKERTAVQHTDFRVRVDSASIALRFQRVAEDLPPSTGWAAAARALLDMDSSSHAASTEYWCVIGHMNHSAHVFNFAAAKGSCSKWREADTTQIARPTGVLQKHRVLGSAQVGFHSV